MMETLPNNQSEFYSESYFTPTSPFTNRFLTKGFLSGKNEWWMYFLGILSAFTGYLLFQLIMMILIMRIILLVVLVKVN